MASSLYRWLEGKNSEEALIERISETFNLAPIFARTYLEEMRRLFAEHYQVPERPGTARVHALAEEEPPGKPLEQCRKVAVLLTVEEEGDLEVWRERGLAALRQAKVLRLTSEALEQGALLTQEGERGRSGMDSSPPPESRQGGDWEHGDGNPGPRDDSAESQGARPLRVRRRERGEES